MQSLSGRTALVTGAAGGIGRELVRALLRAGANVMAADIADDRLKELVRMTTGEGLAERLVSRSLDISDQRSCVAAVEAARARFGTLDILVNNGALGMGAIRDDHMTNLVSIEEITPEIWDRFVAVNFSGAWYLTRAAVPAMKQAGWGRIVTVTTSFYTMLRGRFHPYGPIKAGLEAMAAGHAKEFDGTGITVNVVVPGGPADTPMVPASSGFNREDLIPPVRMTYPLLWLCSGAADRVTGRRYVAARWDPAAPADAARQASEAPIAWPELAAAPVWPGGTPKA
ncbi:MAG TPA: SDR family oxidoreductase [Stellaceae bacterium]|nr:SDR family oxidoreductase [Stellaceae bacterium]